MVISLMIWNLLHELIKKTTVYNKYGKPLAILNYSNVT